MKKIIQLDQNLANQIAAWEVVERPLSVVKELVENSIDAWAKNIKIEIKDWGKSFIEITDDGEWMNKEDLFLSIDKYTTSKIKSLEDLYNVMTFWFRWEALASISSVSNFEIISKHKESNNSYKLLFNNLNWKKIEETSSNIWTTITIKDLFYNTPARLNYLKTDKTEYSKILDYLYSCSLANPEVWIEFISDDRKVFKLNSWEDLKTRIFQVYGEEFLENIIKIEYYWIWINISWYITNPKVSYPTKTRQNIFVNKRPITSPLIIKAINDAYNRFIPHWTNPGFVININVDPTIIDVNVHPRKQEIRFENEQNIFRSVYHSILDKLESYYLIDIKKWESDETPPATLPPQMRGIEKELIDFKTSNTLKEKTPAFYTWSWTKFKSYSPYKDISSNPNQFSINDSLNFTRAILDNNIDNVEDKKISEINNWDLHYTKLWKIIWQTFNSYIIVENDNKVIFLDQHALAERVIYERLIKVDKSVKSQWLLIPENIKLTTEEMDIIENQKNIFEEIWFEIEILWNSILSVTWIPDFIKKEDLKNIILWIINDIRDWNILKSKTLEEVKNKIFAYTACRSAIKFWNKLNLFEMNKLLNEWMSTYSSTCPHGRPVIFEIDINDLKGKFER